MLSRLFKLFLIITIIGITIYSFSWPNSFVWDDEHLIKDNRFIKNLNNWPLAFIRVLFYRTQGKSNFYRPIQEISYALDYRIWGLNPFGFHLTNSLIHIACALLFSLILYQIFQNPFISFWGGAFFVAHPVHTEAITYISGRADPLALFFILLALTCYIQANKGNGFLLPVSLLSFLLALFSRESSIVFPFVILTYDFVFLKEKKLKIKLLHFFLFIIILGLYLIFRLKFTSIDSFKLYQWGQPWPIRLLTELKIIIRYLLLLLFPHHLHMERFVPWSKSLLDFSIISSLIFISLIIYLCIKLSRLEKALIFFSLFFIITLFPFLNIIPLNAQMAEHWLYLPSIGFFAIFSWGAFRINCWLKNSNVKLGEHTLTLALALILTLYSFLTIKQISTWRDPLTFYKYTAKRAPYSSRIQLCLASAYLEEKKYLEAAGILKILVKTAPENIKSQARSYLASILTELEKLDEAQKELELLLTSNPEDIQGYLNLAKLYLKKDEKEKAIETYYTMMKIDPHFIYSYYELGNLYYKSGNFEEAIGIFKKGLAINEDFPELHNNLGICYAELGRFDEAEREWKEALKLDPYYYEAKYNVERLEKESATVER